MRSFRLLSLLVVVALACGARAGDDDEMFTLQFLDEVYQRAVKALAAGSDVHLREAVPIHLLSAAEALERRMAYAQTMDEFGGMTMGMDYLADFVFSDRILGRYLPDEKAIYIIEEVLERQAVGNEDRAREVLFGVMAHELVHAYDDQTYACLPGMAEIATLVEHPERMPEFQALMSLLEGRATYAAELACRHAGEPVLPMRTLEEARSTTVIDGLDDPATAVAAGVVNVVARAKMVQYVQGYEFSRRAFEYGGEKFFGQVFGSLPLSIKEIEDFTLFQIRWAEELEAKLEAEEASGDNATEDGTRPETPGA